MGKAKGQEWVVFGKCSKVGRKDSLQSQENITVRKVSENKRRIYAAPEHPSFFSRMRKVLSKQARN